jgi:hypothetical protein|tara:strand:- start:96 stop:353 length:258 start_codon:yes stop_codon:yes gene_type:complete
MALGLGLAINKAGQTLDTSAGAAIEDYMWEIPTNGELTPLAVGAVKDFHDTWDLDGTDYMPQLTTTVGDEGYWDLDGTDIQPLDV